MPTPGAKDYAIDLPLTNFAVGYRVQGLVWRDALTIVPVAKENGEFHKWTKEDIFRLPNTERAEGAEANEIEIGKTKVSYSADEHAIRVPLTYRTRDNADNVLNIRTAKTQWCDDIINLRMEKKVAALYADSTVPSVTLAGTDQWEIAGGGQGSTSDPIDDVQAGMDAIRKKTGGKPPNIIIMSFRVAMAFMQHTDIRDLIKHTHNDLLGQGMILPSSLWQMKTLTGGFSEVTSKEGAASATYADVWSDNVYLAYISPMPDPDTHTFGSIFLNREEVRVYDMPWRKSEMIESSKILKEVIVDADAAYAIKDVLA